jgi:hypothetical protein
MAKRSTPEYYCLAVRRNYEEIWRFIGKYDTLEQAQAALDEKRAYVGAFNYDNAELRIISRSDAKKEFGTDWEYRRIGDKPAVETKSRKSAKTSKKA